MNCQDTILATLVNKEKSTDLELHLFINDTKINKKTTLKHLKEPDTKGYTSTVMDGSKWQVKNGVAEYPPIEFYFRGAAGKIFGYFIRKHGTDQLLAAEKFKTPIEIKYDGEAITIKPRLRR